MAQIRIECANAVESVKWDTLVTTLDGGFFHCHAFGMYESTGSATPLFIRAMDKGNNCLGAAVGIVRASRYWPFTAICREAIFGALPITRGRNAALEQDILMAIEGWLRTRGVFQIRVDSYDSPNASHVLSALAYRLQERCEFYIDISRSIEETWNALWGVRRNDVRKARKLGVQTEVRDTIPALESLGALHWESMHRRGVQHIVDNRAAETIKTLLLDKEAAHSMISHLDGTPINAALIGFFGRRAYYVSSGSSSTGLKASGPSHLLWTAIEMMKAKGCTVFNLGGARCSSESETAGSGLIRFKKAFGSSTVMQPAGTKIISRPGQILDQVRRSIRKNRRVESRD